MGAEARVQAAQLHPLAGPSRLIEGRRACCDDHPAEDYLIPPWMGEWHEVKPGNPAQFFAALDAKVHDILEHPDENVGVPSQIGHDGWHQLLYGT